MREANCDPVTLDGIDMINALAYADDIVIGIIGITLIKKVIKVINNWTKEYNMSFNQTKTKIMFHNKFKGC